MPTTTERDGVTTERTPMVEFYYPGSLVSESQCKEINVTDPRNVKVPEGAYAFQLYTAVRREVQVPDGDPPMVAHHRENESVEYYPGGEILSMDDVAALEGDHKILLSNMRCNHWNMVIRSRIGNFQPKTDKTEVL